LFTIIVSILVINKLELFSEKYEGHSPLLLTSC